MISHQILDQEVVIWGVSLPSVAMDQDDINYLKKVSSIERPPLEWIWKEMDHVWDSLSLDNKAPLNGQVIGDFYSHPVWLINGVFSAIDPLSVQHRGSIAAFVNMVGAKRVADYGGGFGELALKMRTVSSDIQIDIVEPYPSMLGMLRVEEESCIKFVNELEGQYDCVIAQDVLEHVEQPLELTEQIVKGTEMGGYVIFANCFYPVIKCHLPATFYLRHTFISVVRCMGLRFEGTVNGASHALIFKRVRKIDKNMLMIVNSISKLVGPLLNIMASINRVVQFKMRKH